MEKLAPAVFSRHQIAGVLNGLEDPAVLLSTELRILASNAAYRVRFGRGKDLVGRPCYKVSHRYDRPCDQEGETCPVHECVTTGDPCRTVHVHHTRVGPEHHDVTTYPVKDEDGTVTSYLEVISSGALDAIQRSQEHLVGHSPAFNRMIEMVRRVAPTNTTTLLLGETGTGKELVARAIHKLSDRAERAFVPVECSGLSESLFESELFGHEKGAFTGATQLKRGLVDAADGGTLFLDEVGDIPLNQQVKLLRLIETGVYRRVGSVMERKARFRLVCATHRDLSDLVREGRFRADLYFRIGAFPIELPPLRERIADLPVLIDHLRGRIGCGDRCTIHPDTMALLQTHDFPGNVRELLNILERADLLADGDTIQPRHLPPELMRRSRTPGGDRSEETTARTFPCGEIVPLAELEECYLREVAQQWQGTNRELAERLGLSERTLYRKLATIRGV